MGNTERFTGLAEVYATSRPDYPAAALDFIQSHCAMPPAACVVDVGAGTGISSRWLAQKGWSVLGIEPNADMRRQAETWGQAASLVPPAPAAHSAPNPAYAPGTAENTGLPTSRADLVVCAQSFHWMAPETALAEFERILKPGGWVALIWNERDASDPFTADFGAIIRAHKESARTEDARRRAGQAFLHSPRFLRKECRVFPHQQDLDEESVLGRARSMSPVPTAPAARAQLSAALRGCFARWQENGRAVMRYHTSLYTGQKPNAL
jgi:SAM-dependent methyltransferase